MSLSNLMRSAFVQLIQQEGDRATYSLGMEILAAAIPATPTDLLQLIGAAGKVIRLSRFEITADAAAAGIIDCYLYKRTALNTGGTAAPLAPIAHDSQSPAPSAVLQQYSVLASPLGAGVIIKAAGVALPVASTTGYPFAPTVWTFGTQNDQMHTLRNANESITFNMGGAAVPAGLDMWLNLTWTEDVV
jgi:hypothetical protein